MAGTEAMSTALRRAALVLVLVRAVHLVSRTRIHNVPAVVGHRRHSEKEKAQ